MSKKNEKPSYLTRSDCERIITFIDVLLNLLIKSYKYCDNSTYSYHLRKFFKFKYLLVDYIHSFYNFSDFEYICDDDDFEVE